MLLIRRHGQSHICCGVVDQLSMKLGPVLSYPIDTGIDWAILLFDRNHGGLRHRDHGHLRGMHWETMIYSGILHIILRLLVGIFYRSLDLGVGMWMMLLVLMLMLVVVLLRLWLGLLLLLLLLAISPALHHRVFCCRRLAETMVRLYGCDVPSRVLRLLLYLIHLHGPRLASIVLVPRVEFVGKIIVGQASSGHGEE